MRKSSFLILFSAIMSVSIYAQKSRGFDAHSYFEDYKKSGDIASLNNAKKNIDSAAIHPETKDNPSIQVSRGLIYLASYEAQKDANLEKYKSITDEQDKALAVFENTPTTDLIISYEAFKKAKSLDEKNKFSAELENIENIGTYFDYAGRARLNTKKYADALINFEQAYNIKNKNDSTLLYFCAISADYSDNKTKAKEYYGQMIDKNASERPNIYLALANVYFDLKDTVGGLEVLKKGRGIYPSNSNIVITEANYYIKTKKSEEALDGLNKAISLNSSEVNLYLTRGNVYDDIATQIKDWEKDTLIERKRTSYFEKAEKDYQKGLELDPTNFTLLFNLGVLNFNQGAIINNKASSNATNIETYNRLSTQANVYFKKSADNLEKALAQKNNDPNIVPILKQLYFLLKETEKLKNLENK